MSWQATAWAAKQRCGAAGGKCLLYAIANYADENGRCWPSDDRLAADTEMTTRSIQTWKAKFVEMGLAFVARRGHREGRAAYDVITLRIDDDATETHAGEHPAGDDEEGTGSDDAGADDALADAAENVRPENSSGGQNTITTGNQRHNDRKLTTERPETDDIPIRINLQEPSGTDSPQPPAGGLSAFEAFKKAFGMPDADWGRAERKWKTIKPDVRRLALASAENYRRQCAATAERQKTPATFLGRPEMMARHRSVQTVSLKNWSSGWWALFWGRLRRGEKVAWQWTCACRPGSTAEVVEAQSAPGAAEREALVQVPHDGDAGQAWAAWLAARGHRLPHFEARVWLWMPSQWPPEAEGSAEGDAGRRAAGG